MDKIRLTWTATFEYTPDPSVYPDTCKTIEDMAKYDCENGDVGTLLDVADFSSPTFQIVRD